MIVGCCLLRLRRPLGLPILRRRAFPLAILSSVTVGLVLRLGDAPQTITSVKLV